MSTTVLEIPEQPAESTPAPRPRPRKPRRKTAPVLKQPRLFCGCDMQQVETVRVAGGLAALYTTRSPGKSTSNEDAAAVYPLRDDVAVLAVADGLGGARAGEEASSRTLAALENTLRDPLSESDALRGAILDGIEEANRSVQAIGLGTASTLALVSLQKDGVRPYHVGDSMILLCGGRGKIKLQTVSHSPVGFAVEAGILDEAEAMHHEDRHLVSNVIGSPEMRIEIGARVKFKPRDTLLLASDGLFDNLHVDEIVGHIRKGPLQKSITRLIAAAKERMAARRPGHPSKPDDLTVIAYRPSGR